MEEEVKKEIKKEAKKKAKKEAKNEAKEEVKKKAKKEAENEVKEEVKEEVKKSKEKDLNETKPLYKMTVKELKEVAMEIPHDHENVAVSDMKKDELLTFIKEAREIKEEEEPEKEKKKKKKPRERQTLSKKEIQEKIIQLREKKRAAQETRNQKKIDLLRRHISRLKKQTRKIAQT